MTDAERQQIIDEEHLRLLRVGFIVSGVLSCIFALFPLIYVVLGLFLAVAAPGGEHGDGPPAAVGLFMAGIGAVVSLFIAAAGILKLFAGRAIGQRRSRGLCYAAAGISCLDVPFGTLVGICTFMVLSRPSVERLFASPRSSMQVAAPLEYRPLFAEHDQHDSPRQ